MKKLIMAVVLAAFTFSSMAQEAIKLPNPERRGGKPLYEVLGQRQTNRKFSPKHLTEQQLSNLLWCANGVNRQDGRRTAPSARNAQEIEIYLFNDKGVFLYDANANVLMLVKGRDMRSMVTKQESFHKAPVILVYYANYEKMEKFDEEAREFYGAIDAGYVSQNVYLFCAQENLNTVVLGYIERNALMDIINRPGKAILAQPVGFPGE